MAGAAHETHGQGARTATRPRTVAVLLAGGVGARLGSGVPKQLVQVAHKTILEHALAAFDRHPRVEEILVLMTPGHLDEVHEIVRAGGYHKVSRVLEGGQTRTGTTRRALAALGDRDASLLLHDAARPLVTARIIDACLDALERWDAAVAAIPSADTVVEVTDQDTVAAVPPRTTLRRVQTPQAFRAAVIREAYRLAEADPDFVSTDDCSVVLRYLPEVPIGVVPGDERNIKVTDPVDLHLADALLRHS